MSAFELNKKFKTIAPVRLFVSSFLLVIIIGTVLLMLPIAARSGQPTSFVDSLFTTVSATCVTGLVAFDTWTHWNDFGQAVILMLIQVGGLGIITLTTGFTLLVRRRLGLRDMQLAMENTSGDASQISHLVRIILTFTLTCEAIGALLLMIRFVPQFGLYGIWISVFIAVSAFCNAGFDILGFQWKDGSLIGYVDDPLVSNVVAVLIIIGGLGFIVTADVYRAKVEPILHRRKPTHLGLHSSIVILMTIFLLVIGTALFLLAEYGNTLKDLNFFGKLNASFFQSASARTAGFASVNIAEEHDISKLLTVLLMFIGASPASTGGGIKTTTAVVLASTVISVIRGHEDTVLFKRRIDKSIVYRALAIVSVALLVVLIATAVILTTNEQEISTIDALFESVSRLCDRRPYGRHHAGAQRYLEDRAEHHDVSSAAWGPSPSASRSPASAAKKPAFRRYPAGGQGHRRLSPFLPFLFPRAGPSLPGARRAGAPAPRDRTPVPRGFFMLGGVCPFHFSLASPSAL